MISKMLALRPKLKKRKGFTMIELIVVIAILAILAAIAIPAYNKVRTGAEEAAERANANTLMRTVNMYNAMAKVKILGKSDTKFTNQKFDLKLTDGDLVTMDLSTNIPTTGTKNEFAEAAKWIEINDTTGNCTMLSTKGV